MAIFHAFTLTFLTGAFARIATFIAFFTLHTLGFAIFFARLTAIFAYMLTLLLLLHSDSPFLL